MTDSTNVNETLEALVTEYESGVENHESSDALGWLNTRSEIEHQWDELTSEQSERVEAADSILSQHAGEIAGRLSAEDKPLRDARNNPARPPEEWWWYLDVVSHVSEDVGVAAAPQQSWYSRAIVIVEWVVIAVAIFVIAKNLLPQLQSANVTPTATSLPTETPGPTPTQDVSIFDMSQSTVFKTPDDVVEIPLPKGWQLAPSQAGSGAPASLYQFAPTTQTQTATLLVIVDVPSVIYTSFLNLTTTPKSVQDALTTFKAGFPATSGFTFTDVQTAKVGNLDGYMLAVTIPASTNPNTGTPSPASTAQIYIADAAGGKIALVQTQVNQSYAALAKPALDKMISALVINAAKIPSPTPTLTPIPLELTSTALSQQLSTVQAMIIALTPTSTPVPTQAATGAASGAATSSVISPTQIPTNAAAPATQAATSPAS